MSLQVLIIDDEDDIRDVAEMCLEFTTDWEVKTARGGVAGIDIAAQHRPDAILLDVMMPEVDGPETLRRLRESKATADIPVVFLTAKSQPADVVWLRGLGSHGVIAKPFDPMKLAKEIALTLAWKIP